MLPLTFANPADYTKLDPTDKLSILGLTTFVPGVPLTLAVKKASGESFNIKVRWAWAWVGVRSMFVVMWRGTGGFTHPHTLARIDS